eukprot:g8675.t1
MPFTGTDKAALLLLASLMFLDDDGDDFEMPLLQAIGTAGFDEAADFLDGSARDGTTKPHAERYWERTGRYLSSAQFRSAFRCRKTTFATLVRKLYGTTDFCRRGARGPFFDPCERVAIFLSRLGHDTDVRETSRTFGLSEGAVCYCTLEVANLIEEKLRRKHVAWPSPAEQREISTEWELEKGLRNVIGAIDGTHIKVSPPEALARAYYNYKHFYSISLLAIVDNEGLFRWFCSGAPGSCGDSGVLQHSQFYHAAEAERTMAAAERRILANGAVILGDSAFAESDWMRTPIPKPTCRAERFFNFKHSSHRSRVEHAYGRVKKKFPALAKGLDCHIKNAPLLVNACVVLHNFIFALEGQSPRDQGKDNAPTKNGTGHNIVAGCGPAASARAQEVEHHRGHFLLREWGAPGSRADRRRKKAEKRMRRNNGTLT